MKKLKISGRDIRIFFLGMFCMLLIILIYDWKDFKRGFAEGYNSTGKEQVK